MHLALAVADKILMLENAIYSILSPEGFASILWKDKSRAKEAAEAMKLTARDLKGFKIIDEVIEEPEGGAQNEPEKMCEMIKAVLRKNIDELKAINTEELLEKRYEKFRKIK